MRRGARWALRAASLCCAVCTLYGAASLLLVQMRLHEGSAEVRVLLEGGPPQNSMAADEEPQATLDRDAEGLLAFGRYETAVYHGVTAQILSKGAGHIASSAELGGNGNCVLYGHRDSAFRFLEKIQKGDALTLLTREGEQRYTVTEILIVEPDDPAIFIPAQTAMLSLVTCYPFTFVGPALQRCVVRATLTSGAKSFNGSI